MKTKEFGVQYKDEGTGMIEGYASTWIRQPDSYGEVVAKGAFSKTLLDRWNGGKGIPFLWSHRLNDLSAFSLGELQTVFEAVQGRKLDSSNFRRFILKKYLILSGTSGFSALGFTRFME